MTHDPSDTGARFTRVDLKLKGCLGLPAQDAEDISQEAWVNALTYGPDLTELPEPKLLIYLKKSAISVLSHRVRAQSDALRHVVARLLDDLNGDDDAGGATAPASEVDDPARRAAGRERLERLRRALPHLGAQQRLHVTLRCVFGAPSKAVAHVLGCSANAVDQSVKHARRRLRALLPDEGHLGSEVRLVPAELWREGGARIALEVVDQQVRRLAAGASLFLTLRGRSGDQLAGDDALVADCWVIAHCGQAGAGPDTAPHIGAPRRALWSPERAAGTVTVQVPLDSSGATDVRELFVFAGWFPDA